MKFLRWFWVPVLLVIGHSWELAAQRDGNAAQRLVGAWRLVSWQERLTDGTMRPNRVIGPKGVGSLIYTDTGRMCAVLMDPGRPAETQAPSRETDRRSAFNGFVAYCGKYDVDENEGYVVHHVEMDTNPNIVGTDRKRSFVLTGNRLTLKLPQPLQDGVAESALVWERVGK